MPVIFPFGEGKTEKIIFAFLVDKWFPETQFKKFISVGGNTQFRRKILDAVQGDLYAGRDEIRILVFRDLDNGEQVDDVVQSFQDIVWLLLRRWDFRPQVQVLQTNAIYKCESPAESEFAGLRFVLHIANHTEARLPFTLLNQTSDGYILKLALAEQVLSRFAGESRVKIPNKILYELVAKEIPAAIREKGISFNEDKDYLSVYLTATRFWVVKRTEEKARLIKIILERAWRHNSEHFNQVFASWRTAIEEVIS